MFTSCLRLSHSKTKLLAGRACFHCRHFRRPAHRIPLARTNLYLFQSAPSGPPPNYKPSGNTNLPQQPPQAHGTNSEYYNQAGQQERGFGGYPQQHQGGYPQQGGYQPQGYPQQGGYPPQGYPPQQQGYYPQGQQPMMYQQQQPMMYQQAPQQKQRSGMEGCLAALCCL